MAGIQVNIEMPSQAANFAAQAAPILHRGPLIERALRDLAACRLELGNFHFYQKRCDEIVTLLAEAIRVAQTQDSDA